MNILIDINHPAHVHLFRNVYAMLVEHGNNVSCWICMAFLILILVRKMTT